MSPVRFRSIPVEFEAVQWTGDNWPEVCEFGNGTFFPLEAITEEMYDEGGYAVLPADGYPGELSVICSVKSMMGGGEKYCPPGTWVCKDGDVLWVMGDDDMVGIFERVDQ